LIRLTQVSKQFSGKRRVTALEEITLQVARGEMVSIIGPSGSGKSTLLNLIGGLDQPSSGEIHIEGQSIARMADDELTH
jgi:putative ABC transport system ATP-binding protein